MGSHGTVHADGAPLALDPAVPHVDTIGVEWRWTGGRDTEGEPLMQARVRLGARCTDHCGCQAPASEPALPLATVWRDHGPLIPLDGAEVAS